MNLKKEIKKLTSYRWMMFLLIVHCSLFLCLEATAQTFTQQLQKKVSGEGTVTITQDKSIDQLVNGPVVSTPAQPQTAQPQRQPTEKTAENKETAKPPMSQAEIQPDTATILPDGRKKVMKGGYKVAGYRVQAFAGGNQRRDRLQAEQVGNTIKASYPNEPVYVHFYSPRWICRVGNYRTYEEAHQMLLNIRKLGISGASIVKGKITVQY